MNNKIAAADILTRFGTQLNPFFAAAEEFRKVGGMEQAAAEAKGQLSAAQRDLKVAQEELEKVRQEIDSAKSEAKKVLADAKRDAEGHVSASRQKAKEEADKVTEAAKAEADAHSEKVHGLKLEADKAWQRLQELNRQLSDKQKALDSVESARRSLLEKIS